MFLLWRSSKSSSDDVLWPRNFLQHNNRNQAYDIWFTLVSRCLVKEIVERVRGGIVSLEFVVLQHFVSKSISNVKELVVFVFWYGLVWLSVCLTVSVQVYLGWLVSASARGHQLWSLNFWVAGWTWPHTLVLWSGTCLPWFGNNLLLLRVILLSFLHRTHHSFHTYLFLFFARFVCIFFMSFTLHLEFCKCWSYLKNIFIWIPVFLFPFSVCVFPWCRRLSPFDHTLFLLLDFLHVS